MEDTSTSLRFADRAMDQGGFYDAIDAFGPEIVDNLKPKFLPRFDDEILRGSGSPDADMERRSLVHLAKIRLQREIGRSNEMPIAKRIHSALAQLSEASEVFEKPSKLRKGEDLEHVRKSRKWFKGLGQIGQGDALSIANVAVAIGTLHLPVPIETRTWGSLESVVTGVGTVMNGIGDLRGE